MKKLSMLFLIVFSLVLMVPSAFAATTQAITFQVPIAGMAIRNSDNGNWYMLQSKAQDFVDLDTNPSGWFGTKKLIAGHYDKIIILIGRTVKYTSAKGNSVLAAGDVLPAGGDFNTITTPTGTIVPTVTGYTPDQYAGDVWGCTKTIDVTISKSVNFDVTWTTTNCLETDGLSITNVYAPTVTVTATGN